MSRTRIAGVVAVLAVAGLAGCSNSGSDSPTVSGPSSTSTSSTSGGASALTISGFAYDPTPLTVSPGATITVTNKDGSEHTVTSSASGAFKLGDIKKDTPVTFKAPTKAGTYTFFCEYHSTMHGTLVVKG